MRIREIKKNKPSKPRDPNHKAMQDLRSSGASGSHGDKTKDIPRKEKHKGKSYDINEKDPCWKGYKQIGMKKKVVFSFCGFWLLSFFLFPTFGRVNGL